MNQQEQGNGGNRNVLSATGGGGVGVKQEVNDDAQKRAAEQAALQQQIQQQLQAQLKAQIEAANAKGQSPVITPEQITAQAQAMVQAAAQAQAVVTAAKERGNGLVPMNAAQIAALSRLQAQAIVNARPSTALIASGQSEDVNAKPTAQQIETQIQLQTQALIHAHTTAQIAAGIFKDDNNAVVSAVTTTTAHMPVKKQRITKGVDADDIKLTATQMAQQNQLTVRQTALRNDLQKSQRSQLAHLRNSFQGTATQEQVQQMQELQARHANEQREQQLSFQKEMQDLQSLFRQQNNSSATGYNNTNTGNPPPNLAMQNPPSLPVSTMHHHQQHHTTQLSNDGSTNVISLTSLPHTTGTNESSTSTIDTSAFRSSLSSSLSKFWSSQMEEMMNLPIGDEQDFKNHNDLPLARIKRIMKSDEDVRMISAEAPVLFAKACEMFILELTLRSWAYSESNKRRTLQKEDIQMAIQRTDIFDFLVDVIN